MIKYRTAGVVDRKVFYRRAGDPSAKVIVGHFVLDENAPHVAQEIKVMFAGH